MKKELVVAWMDRLIEAWFQLRMLRTLSNGGGVEYATYIGLSSYMEIHLDFNDESDKDGMADMAFFVGAELKEEEHSDEHVCYYFMYRGFKFFALDDRR